MQVDGTYINHVQIDFGHTVMSKAIARGYETGVNMFDKDCSEDGVPYSWGADFECELAWEYLGWN